MKSVADLNRYPMSLIDKIIKKHAEKVKRKNSTTLKSLLDTQEKTEVAVSYVPQTTNT